MTQEEKQLLLRDLCSRLPYGVICEDKYGNAYELNDIDIPNTATFKCSDKSFWVTDLDGCKPYLFPMPNKDEDEGYNKFLDELIEIELKVISGELEREHSFEFEMNYYHENHIDCGGLIPRGLAKDATNLGIYGNK